MPIPTIKENIKESPVLFLTFKIVNGLAVFTAKEYFDIIIHSLNWCREKYNLKIYAYTILNNHMHLVVEFDDNNELGEIIIKNFRGFTANQIIKKLKQDNKYNILDEMRQLANQTTKQEFKVWRRNNWPKAITSDKFFNQKIDYVDYNAEKHKIVKDIETYLYTSYHNHYCEHAVILKTDAIYY